MPIHVGIIMDGNGRWAKEKGKIRTFGHKEGAENLKKLVRYVYKDGLKCLSVFAFSTENFKRPTTEVKFLMDLFVTMFKKERKVFEEENVKVVFSGRKENLRKDVLEAIESLESITKDNNAGILNVCLNYGSRQELTDTFKKLASDIKNNKLEIENINEDLISNNLYKNLPDLDLVIRTSGEHRLSNFMLWQASYAEWYFPKILFPDFDEKEFDKAIIEFNRRNRRFGGV